MTARTHTRRTAGPWGRAPSIASPPVSRNAALAARLDEVARLLDGHGGGPHRVAAYRRAAETFRRLETPVADLLEERGIAGLEALPGVGPVIARAARTFAVTGRLPMLDRLRAESDPVRLLMTVPGIGSQLAERIHHDLGLGTLEELEVAAHDGRLSRVSGIGRQRLEGIRDALSGRLARVRAPSAGGDEAPVAELLDVDAEYRRAAEAGRLPRIAPRRFNPRREAWLPILHATRGTRGYTGLFSNTARAHRLGRTRDWVVLYYDGDGRERQATVVTSRRGPLHGKRVVRGREAECATHYGLPWP